VPIQSRLQTTTPTPDFTTADAADRRSRATSNSARNTRRRTGDATADAGLNEWGAAVTDQATLLAPYQIEVAEGQVAHPGQRDGVVEMMQLALKRLGFAVTDTRVYDDATVAGLREWQRLYGLPASDTFGPAQLTALDRAVACSFNLQQFQANAPGVPESTLTEYLPHLNAAMYRANIDSDARKAMFIAQIGHESDGFNTLEEYASGSAYEGRTDLGNVHRGDGRRFKGRGPIQITGRANYTSYGEAIDQDLVNHPELAATPEVGFRLAAEYWTRNDLNRYAHRGQIDTVTERINGGQNGQADRRSRWARAKRVNRDWDRTPDLVPRPRQRPDPDAPEPDPVAAAGTVDSVFQLLAADRAVEAMADAERIATGQQDVAGVPEAASRARDVARYLLDAQEAFDTERFGDAKQAAHDAAVQARSLRDSGVVIGTLSDPVIARAGSWWQRASSAERTRGRGADLALVQAAVPLRRGDQGDAVAALQRLLGMDVAGAAGTFGPATEAAVKEFQRRKGLTADGIVGAGTAGKLG
jgi:predicted chitinase